MYECVSDSGPGRSVGTRLATIWTVRGSNPGVARFSSPVQTGPGAHPVSCTMGTGSFRGVKNGRGVTLTLHPLLVQWSWRSRAIPLLLLWAVRPVQSLSACTRVTFTFFTYSCFLQLTSSCFHYKLKSDSWGKVNIYGCDRIGHSGKKNVCYSEWLSSWSCLNLARTNSISFLFVGLYQVRSLHEGGGYRRRIAHSHFGCCCRYKEMWRPTQKNMTRTSDMSCKSALRLTVGIFERLLWTVTDLLFL